MNVFLYSLAVIKKFSFHKVIMIIITSVTRTPLIGDYSMMVELVNEFFCLLFCLFAIFKLRL